MFRIPAMGDLRIRTVLGDITPDSVGITLPHEHLSLDIEDIFFVKPPAQHAGKELLPFRLENMYWINHFPNSHKDNLHLHTEHEAVLDEIKHYKQNGGCTLVENTNSFGRDLPFLKMISETTGVHIVAGTGLYVHQTHPNDINNISDEKLAARFEKEITDGCEGSDICCGILGEVGCSWPIHDTEKKSLRASAIAQVHTGCPVIVHPGRNSQAPGEALRILQEAGANKGKVVMSHLDRTLHTDEDILEFAALGCYCEFDLFGLETTHYQFQLDIDMPNDGERIRRIKCLIEAGYEDKILISHDVHTKHRLVKYGGHGYSHILENIVPKMRDRGVTETVINKILVENPKTWLQF